MTFSKYMKDLREEKKLSQVKTAEILDISVTALKLIENGKTKFPSEKLLNNLCSFQGCEEIDVMTNILFNEEKLETASTRYLACRYLAYMYLQGWNIEESPFRHSIWTKMKFEFDAKISKKRDLKNIQLVSSYDRFLNGTLKTKEDAIAFIVNATCSVVTVLSPFRGLKILFDVNSDEQIHMYDLFENGMIGHIDFDIEIIAFNSKLGILVETKNVRSK